MFDQRFAELMKMENRKPADGLEEAYHLGKPVHFKPSLMDRVLPKVCEAMINLGLKLKDRPHLKVQSEQAQSPNYLIML